MNHAVRWLILVVFVALLPLWGCGDGDGSGGSHPHATGGATGVSVVATATWDPAITQATSTNSAGQYQITGL